MVTSCCIDGQSVAEGVVMYDRCKAMVRNGSIMHVYEYGDVYSTSTVQYCTCLPGRAAGVIGCNNPWLLFSTGMVSFLPRSRGGQHKAAKLDKAVCILGICRSMRLSVQTRQRLNLKVVKSSDQERELWHSECAVITRQDRWQIGALAML
jgi:hypothetical protein